MFGAQEARHLYVSWQTADTFQAKEDQHLEADDTFGATWHQTSDASLVQSGGVNTIFAAAQAKLCMGLERGLS